MRTLKKVLCLVLSLSLVCSLAVVGVGASAFTDDSQIKYKEAVDVLVDLGVINGKEAGQFDPKGNLTRAEASKILAYMMLGAKSAEALPAQAVFTDVPATFWASKYIGFAVTEGYVNGNGDGTFDPDGKLTAYQWAKMLLCALGYDSKIENFVGDAWAVNVAKKALDNDVDLFDGNDGADYSAACTREEAVLYAFNTLQCDLVDYETKGTTVTVGGVEVVTGASKAEPVKNNGESNGNIKRDGYKQFAEKYFDKLKKSTTEDDLGNPGTKWRNDNSDIGTYADEADYTTTAKIKIKDLYKELDLDGSTPFKVYTDGVENKYINADGEQTGALTIDKTTTTKIGGNGVLLSAFYDEDDNTATITFVNTYIGKITSVDTNDDDNRIVTVDGKDYETENFAKKDWVMYTQTKAAGTAQEDAIQSMTAAVKKTGKVEKKTGGDTYVIDGTSYTTNYNVTGSADADDKVDFYLDANGYIIKIKTSDDNVSTDKLAYVMGYDAGDSIDDPRAKLLLADGTKKTVTLNDDSDVVAVGNIVSYTVDDDNQYELTIEDRTDYKTSVTLEKKTASIALSQKTIKATSKTVYVVASDDDGDVTYDVYTGYTNVPKVTGADVSAYYNTDDEAVLVYIFVDDANVDTDNSNLTYIAFDPDADMSSNKDEDYYELNAVVDGKITTLQVRASVYNTHKNDEILAVKSYKTNSKGYVTGVTAVTDEDDRLNKVQTVVVNDDSIELGGTAFAWAKDVKVIVADSDNDYKLTLSDIDGIVDDEKTTVGEGDYDNIYYAFDHDDNEVTVVILVKNAK